MSGNFTEFFENFKNFFIKFFGNFQKFPEVFSSFCNPEYKYSG